MERVDLHSHSTASDGSMTPSEVVKKAKEVGLAAIALTDHDTMAGIPEAEKAAKEVGIELIPGIEVSSIYNGHDIHIVGLFQDYRDTVFQKRLEGFLKLREERNLKMIEKMKNAGIDISMEKIRKLDGDAVITRANLANYLLHIGYISTIKEAFDKYLSPGKPFYVPKTGITPKEAIQAIREAGGIAILAHPLIYKFSDRELNQLIQDFIGYGLQGIETYYSTYNMADERYVKRLADHYGLIYSGGSDFHGERKPHIQLGVGMGKLCIPYDVLENLKRFKMNGEK